MSTFTLIVVLGYSSLANSLPLLFPDGTPRTRDGNPESQVKFGSRRVAASIGATELVPCLIEAADRSGDVLTSLEVSALPAVTRVML